MKFFPLLTFLITITNYVNSIVFINKFLSKEQWFLIDKILLNPNTNFTIKNKVYNILYKYYNQWAFTKAYKFKQFHKQKCKHISTLELYNYASIGLYKSVIKYNPNVKTSFINYANYFVEGELLKGLTDLHPITSLSKSTRKKGYGLIKKPQSSIQFTGSDEWIWDKINKNKIYENQQIDNILEHEKYVNLWLKINELPPLQKRIMYYKYNFFFDKLKSNREISLLMNYSEEWIRQNVVAALIFLDLLHK
jgi:RNA polymerase sigma factor (sigma-70 family)